MKRLQQFTVTMTLCFTPEHLGEAQHHTSPPRNPADFADFAAWAVARYAPAQSAPTPLAAMESAGATSF
jgi:hypothetical protein